jgi:hypothetical protein
MIRVWLLLLAIVGVLATPAYSQVSPFRGQRGAPLTQNDITALFDASYRLLGHADLAKGDKDGWNVSGSNGTVTAGDAVKRHGLACRALNYQFVMSAEPGRTRKGALTWCKTDKGWKIG